MREHSNWVRVASFGSGGEAQNAVNRLRQEGVYAICQGYQSGVYGVPSLGLKQWGVDVLVPDDVYDEALELLAAA